ncbi:hypothetical protein FACS1894190_00180 [Spirochaetia bacterium]|nr:hypothetical protein FACS1894190_00180 [Spirochaetia bacterium]
MSRIASLIVIYAVVFIALSIIQFAKQGSFSRQLGDLRVSGVFRQADGEKKGESDGEGYYSIYDGVSVFFGGMEFRLTSKEVNGLVGIDEKNIKKPLMPVKMVLSKESVRFRLSDGHEISFFVQTDDGVEELVISAVFSEGIAGIEVPYRSLKRAKIRVTGSSSISVSYNDTDYIFDRNILDTDRSLLTLSYKDPVVAYRIVPKERGFNPVDFIIAGGMEKFRYDENLLLWCDKVFPEWERRVFSGSTNELTITSYVAEAARRGNFSSAVSNVPLSFTNSQDRTFLSSTFLGRLDLALRTISASERERTGKTSTIIRNNSTGILREEFLFEYLSQRSRTGLFDDAIKYVRTLEPDSVTIDLCAGIFEGWWAWNTWHKGEGNPFDYLITVARSIVSELLVKDAVNGNVFVVSENTVDVLYNIRLGMAITAYGESVLNSEWAAVGRSMVLSALSFSAPDASISEFLTLAENGSFAPRPGAGIIEPTRLYQLLRISDYYPHSVGAGTVVSGVWLWTMSPSIGASFENNVLDISVSFPLEETHYLLISNISSFKKIQMRDMDYRSDPQFERYNSPGWAYSASERTLLVKLVHRSQNEHIKIFF